MYWQKSHRPFKEGRLVPLTEENTLEYKICSVIKIWRKLRWQIKK